MASGIEYLIGQIGWRGSSLFGNKHHPADCYFSTS
jgi:hypothetical protein